MEHVLLFFFSFHFEKLSFFPQIADPVTRQSFIGSMEDVKFDDTPVGIWNFEDAENNLVGENAR